MAGRRGDLRLAAGCRAATALAVWVCAAVACTPGAGTTGAGDPATAGGDRFGDGSLGDGAGDTAAGGDPFVPISDWQAAHCVGRACYYVMQNQPGADDTACNGEHPTDLGTTDANGKRDCPFASFASFTLRNRMAPPSGNNRSRTFFVGAGTYVTWPGRLNLRGDGANASEAVILTNYRGAPVTLDGGNCPATCSLDTPSGPVLFDPCCPHACRCGVDPSCQPTFVGGVDTGECGVPWDKSDRLLVVAGSWVRVEGIGLQGCAEDAVAVSYRTAGSPPAVVPNDSIFIVNNRIAGCDINENIKAA